MVHILLYTFFDHVCLYIFYFSLQIGGGSDVDLSLTDLQEMATRQQQQIETQQQMLVAKQQRLKFLKQQESKHQVRLY